MENIKWNLFHGDEGNQILGNYYEWVITYTKYWDRYKDKIKKLNISMFNKFVDAEKRLARP